MGERREKERRVGGEIEREGERNRGRERKGRTREQYKMRKRGMK